MKKKNTTKTDEFISKAKFCVECGAELDDYSIQSGESDEDAKKRFHNCQKTGKFNGDVCSRIFIHEYDENTTEEDLKNINFPDDAET